jgi:hypothetical protein
VRQPYALESIPISRTSDMGAFYATGALAPGGVGLIVNAATTAPTTATAAATT